ncbi:glycerate kinase [Lederbergia panacisoli]|uniref:glycerate kinase n=1 Tax=Lederbergia panacisoli TaxID=1255251 RepID=UPI00214B2866|nr:glycerate kinase [Lederbergia panacisoli]MCR2822580.1 glycerate kinase [Lederbergia panacisoli]
MKIVIAPDSFKGSVSAKDAALAIEKGVKKAFPNADTVLIPVADGGEGTLETLITATRGQKVYTKVTGPLGKEVDAHFGVLGDQTTCIIEMALASGLNLIDESERNPMLTTTYGTGELIKSALDQGYRNFVLAIGGSATNDGGVGMLQALGMQFKDKDGNEIGYGGGELDKIHGIFIDHFDKRIKESTFSIASDVENPLIGEKGASYVFGPQKGATAEMVKILDKNLLHYANLVEIATGIRLHDMPGAGAAGGIGGAFSAFFPSDMQRGIEVVLEYANFADVLNGVDLVITGEGKVDFQTAYGKTPMGVAQAAQKKNVPVIILAGSVGENIQNLYQYGVVGIFSIINGPMSLDKAMKEAEGLLETSVEQVCRTYFWNHVDQ